MPAAPLGLGRNTRSAFVRLGARLGVLYAQDPMPLLHTLIVGPPRATQGDAQCGELDPLWDVAPRLQTLEVHGAQVDGLGPLQAPQLRRLVLVGPGPDLEVIDQLSAAEVPGLEVLHIGFRGFDGSVQDLHAALSPRRLPELRDLALNGYDVGDDVIGYLRESALLERLGRLSLTHCQLTDDEVQILADQPEEFAIWSIWICPATRLATNSPKSSPTFSRMQT